MLEIAPKFTAICCHSLYRGAFVLTLSNFKTVAFVSHFQYVFACCIYVFNNWKIQKCMCRSLFIVMLQATSFNFTRDVLLDIFQLGEQTIFRLLVNFITPFLQRHNVRYASKDLYDFYCFIKIFLYKR